MSDDASGGGDRDEREWDADKREGEADERERLADERERGLDTRGAEPEVPAEPGHAAALAERRRAATGATGLALAFAEITRHLYEAENLEAVLERIVDAAVAIVTGCDMASVTVRDDGKLRTVASTDDKALDVDRAQYAANEGPCVDAIGHTVVHAPVLPDERWPSLGSRPLEHGVHAVASYRLGTADGGVEGDLAGSLNAYASSPEAYSDEALEIGLVLALHGSSAIRAVRRREALELFGRQLHEALSSRDLIGQAKGILMERLKLTPEDAFDFLRRASQRLNVKLVEVAQRLAETGELDKSSASS